MALELWNGSGTWRSWAWHWAQHYGSGHSKVASASAHTHTNVLDLTPGLATRRGQSCSLAAHFSTPLDSEPL